MTLPNAKVLQSQVPAFVSGERPSAQVIALHVGKVVVRKSYWAALAIKRDAARFGIRTEMRMHLSGKDRCWYVSAV